MPVTPKSGHPILDEVLPGLSTHKMIGLPKALPFETVLGFAANEAAPEATADLRMRLNN